MKGISSNWCLQVVDGSGGESEPEDFLPFLVGIAAALHRPGDCNLAADVEVPACVHRSVPPQGPGNGGRLLPGLPFAILPARVGDDGDEGLGLRATVDGKRFDRRRDGDVADLANFDK